jgi:hypothetical protein
MLSRALDTYADLNKTKDREWIHILLSFLKTYIDHPGMELLVHEGNKISYISQLVDAMRVAANELDSGWWSCSLHALVCFITEFLDMAHPAHPAMSILVSNDARMAGTEDGSFLDVTIYNHLPCVSVTLLRTFIPAHRGTDSSYR